MELVDAAVKFAREEETVLALWDKIDAFATSVEQSKGRPEYRFYDGPPFATGLPHYGHILAGAIKDTVTRYAHMTGHHVQRRFGWDCHGLPIEFHIEKELNIKTRQEVLEYGVAKYNEACRGIVLRYAKDWKRIVRRLGRWIDMENPYKSMDKSFMESVWWVFGELWDKELVYSGFKVMPFSTGCHTPLSNFEANLAYRDVDDPAVTVAFPLVGEPNTKLLAWTTTPWTLPSNLALNVNPKHTYVRVRDTASGSVFIVMEKRLTQVYPAPKKKKNKSKNKQKKKDGEAAATAEPAEPYVIESKFPGSQLGGLEYTPPFPYLEKEWRAQGAFRVLLADYVTEESGTGVVHSAPAFGEEDYKSCEEAGIISSSNLPCPVDDNGCFTEEITDFAGVYVKEADKAIMADLEKRGLLVKRERIVHSYPFCWRSDTPLIYRAVPSWFVKVSSLRERLLANLEKTYWVPDFAKSGRFANWLGGATDWCISRNRFWGTPLPIWRSEDGTEHVVVRSAEQLQQYTEKPVVDLHKHHVDDIVIPDPRGEEFPPLRRVEEVFDCWFESGSMPWSQEHYPFENKEHFEATFPADFIAEGIDQTRGWFYTLLVLGTALRDSAPYKNVIVNGMVLAEDGKKMSKKLQNYPDPVKVITKYGADSVRMYLLNSPVVAGDDLRFREAGVRDITKDVLLPWFNTYRFFVENALKFGLDHSEVFVPQREALHDMPNIMDRWVLSSCQSLVKFVRQEMAAYRLNTVVPRLLRFFEELTNWYVRFNRDRLRGTSGKEEASNALTTLFSVLYQQTILMAPLMPFFSETVYQNIRRVLPKEEQQDSVHYLLIPKVDEALIDVDLERHVANMQGVVDLGRIARDKRTLPLKLPLRRLTVVHSDKEVVEGLQQFAHYIKLELNIKELEITMAEGTYVNLSASLDRKRCGRRLRKDVGKVGKEVQKWDTKAIREFQGAGAATVAGHKLELDDVKVVKEFSGDTAKYEAAWSQEILLVLDVVLDDELRAEGTARAAANLVQRLRKECGVHPTDDLEVFMRVVSAKSDTVGAVLKKWQEYVAKKIRKPFALITEEEANKVPAWHTIKTCPLDDAEVQIYIKKND